jgi:integrase
VCQLRGKDVKQQDGVWAMHITDEAGSVKNASSVRHVPLHPYLLDRGFLEFVRQKGDGPLFHPAVRRKKNATTAPARIVAKNLAAWARGLDLQIGREHRKDPNHGWRHYVTALMDEFNITRKVQHEIVGHAPGDVHERYGQVRIDVVAEAIRKLPTPTEFAAKLKAAEARCT